MELLFATSIFSLENQSFLPSSQRARKCQNDLLSLTNTERLHPVYTSFRCCVSRHLRSCIRTKFRCQEIRESYDRQESAFRMPAKEKRCTDYSNPQNDFLKIKRYQMIIKIRYKSSKPPPMTQFLITQFYFKRLGTLYMKRLIYNYLAIWKPLRSQSR